MDNSSVKKSQSIFVLGAGSYASTIRELAEDTGFNVVGHLDDDPKKIGMDLDGVPVRGPIREVLVNLQRNSAVAVAIGDNDLRLHWLIEAHRMGLRTPALASPMSMVSPRATLSDGVYLHPGSHVWTHAKLGLGTIISPNATIAHHTVLGAGCFVSTGANVGAGIVVDDAVMFGIGSTTSTGVAHIASHGLIGAGTVIVRDTEPYGVYVGSPGRLIRVQQSPDSTHR